MTKQEVIDYLVSKFEALEFWEDLLGTLPEAEEKVREIRASIEKKHAELVEIRRGEREDML